MDEVKREELPSALNPLLDEMRSVAKQEGIPEPYNIELRGWDDGTYLIRLVHYWEKDAEDVIDISEDGFGINDETFSHGQYYNFDSIGAAVSYNWKYREIVIETDISARGNPGNDRKVIKQYEAPVEVIEALQSRDGLYDTDS